MTLMSCVKNAPDYEKGGEEDPNCYGVYFPAQSVSDIVLDPADEQALTISVSRDKPEGSITVPIKLTESKEGIFNVPAVTFEDGQSTTEIKITFNGEVGVKYTGNIRVEDPAYAYVYGSKAIGIDFSITREKWNEIGWGTWFENGDNGYFGFEVPEPVLIEENDNTPSIFRVRLKYDANNLPAERDGFGWYVYTEGSDEFFTFKTLAPGDQVIDTEITKDNLIFFNTFGSGYINSNYGAEVKFYHPGSFTNYSDESYWLHNRVLQWQNDSIPAGVAIAPYYYMSGIGGWNMSQDDDVITLMFPGGKLTDYSLSIEAGLSEDGVLPVDFVFGADVDRVKYAAYAGELNATQISTMSTRIIDDREPLVKELSQGGVVNVSFDSTGVYTIVGVSYAPDSTAQATASVSFGYLAEGDANPVVVNCGLETTGKYAAMGYTTENSLEYYVYGKDLDDVKVGIFNHLDFVGNSNGCVASVLQSKSIDAASLAKANSNGFSDVFTKLSPGTTYDLIVVASNGFEQKIISAEATTEGDPLPVYMSYSLNDYDPSFGFGVESELFSGDWNLYATDLFGKLGMREYIGKAVFTDSETPDEEITDDGDPYTDYYMYASGFAGPRSKNFGGDDRVEAILEDGLIIIPTEAATVADPDMSVYGLTAEGKAYGVSYALFGIPVADGYYAFVSNPGYVNQGVTMAGLGYYKGGFYAGYIDYLLVDSSKDDNGLAPAQAAAGIKALGNALRLGNNLVETAEGRMLSFREALARVLPSNVARAAGLKGTFEGRSVSFNAATRSKVTKASAPVKAKLLEK